MRGGPTGEPPADARRQGGVLAPGEGPRPGARTAAVEWIPVTRDTPSADRPPLSADALRPIAAALDRWLATQTEVRRVPGVQAAVRLGDELILSTAHGVADESTGERLTTRHLFRVASHSKTFTAVAVLRQVELGTLRLDDTVGALLPGYADTPLAGVTLRELLSHTAGAVRDGADADHWILDRPFPDAAALQALVRDHGTAYAPQEHFKYSNIGYGMLGAVLEHVTGRPYAEHVRASVLDPLGLTDTHADLTDDVAARAATGHTRAGGRARARVTVEQTTTGALAAATGFVSRAEELSAFYASLALGARGVLSDRSLRLMHRAEATFRRGGGTGTYGLGLLGQEVGGRRLLGHSGGFPGQITRTLFDPATGLAVSVLTTAVDGPAEALAVGVVQLIDLLTAPAADWQALPGGVTAADLDRLAGRYVSLWGATDILRGGTAERPRLVLLDPAAPAPADAAEELRALDATTLRVEDADGFGACGEPIPFDLDAAGRVTRMRVTGVSAWPEEAYRARRGDAWRHADGVDGAEAEPDAHEEAAPVLVQAAAFADLDPATAYRLWALRQAVFVVEQDCPYQDMDGRDMEPATVHLWVCDEEDAPIGTVRLLDDGDHARIGRVVVDRAHRGRGVAAALMEAALEQVGERACVLDAQAHLEHWYGRFGFAADGPEFLEDGIPHVPMRRPEAGRRTP